MTFHTENDRTRHKECERLGQDIPRFRTKRTDLTNNIHKLESSIQDAQIRLGQIERELSEISTVQELARGIGGRGGIPGAMAGEGFAQLFALARQKDELERERQGLQSKLAGLEALLEDAKGRLNNVEFILSELHAAFEQLGCGLSDFSFPN